MKLSVLAGTVCLALAFPGLAAASTTDQPDDMPGYQQVHVMYVLPSDGADRGYDLDGTLAGSVQAWQNWLSDQTGGRGFHLDTAGGALDITFARLSQTDAQLASNGLFIRDAIEQELKAMGFNDPMKILAVYYDGGAQNVCGGGAWPPTLPGTVAAFYIKGTYTNPATPTCDSSPWATAAGPPGYREFAMIHEVFHTIGFVAQCAPNHALAGHVSDDPTDLLYAGNQPWHPEVLDFAGDDYFRTSPDPNCLDLSTVGFLEGNGPPPSPSPTPTPTPTPDPTPGPSPSPTPSPGPSPGPSPIFPAATRCTVPRLTGLTRTEAVKRLKKAGCGSPTVTKRKARKRAEKRRIGRVVAQAPAARKRLLAGARARIVVLRR